MRAHPFRSAIVVAAVVGAGIGGWIALPLPQGLLAPIGRESLTIEDRHGLVLRATRADDGSRAQWVALDAMDPDLVRAFVAVEDQRFYQHHGVDPQSVLRAVR